MGQGVFWGPIPSPARAICWYGSLDEAAVDEAMYIEIINSAGSSTLPYRCAGLKRCAGKIGFGTT